MHTIVLLLLCSCIFSFCSRFSKLNIVDLDRVSAQALRIATTQDIFHGILFDYLFYRRHSEYENISQVKVSQRVLNWHSVPKKKKTHELQQRCFWEFHRITIWLIFCFANVRIVGWFQTAYFIMKCCTPPSYIKMNYFKNFDFAQLIYYCFDPQGTSNDEYLCIDVQ